MLPDDLDHLFDTALALAPSSPAVFQGETVLRSPKVNRSALKERARTVLS